MTTLSYEIRLAPEVVRARLEEAVDRPSIRYWTLPGTVQGRPLVGEVGADRFWWRVRHKERASFAPWLSGRIESGPLGTVVYIDLHSPLTRKVFLVIGLAVACLVLLWVALNPTPDPGAAVVALALIAGMVLFPLLGTRLLADEQRILREAFEEVFAEAIERSGPSAA